MIGRVFAMVAAALASMPMPRLEEGIGRPADAGRLPLPLPNALPNDHRFRPVKLGKSTGRWSGPGREHGYHRGDGGDADRLVAAEAKRMRKRLAWALWLSRAA